MIYTSAPTTPHDPVNKLPNGAGMCVREINNGYDLIGVSSILHCCDAGKKEIVIAISFLPD